MPSPDFARNVFINCPFDDDYAPILQAILFCLVYLNFEPRFALERNDGAETRLTKIVGLIQNSRLSIHDLSRCQSTRAGEYFRLNMPFELGIDFGCKSFFGNGRDAKKFLILEEQKYRYQASLSDISGSDIEAHGGDYQKAVRKVRNWLVTEADAEKAGAQKILNAYTDFQEWYYEKQLAAGFSEEDIQDYPTTELLGEMKKWMALGKPI